MMHWAYYVCYSLKCVLYKSGVPGYHKYHRCKDQPEIKFCLATLQTDYYKQKDYFLFIQDPKSLKSNAWKAMNSPQKKKKNPTLLNAHWREIKFSPLSGIKTQGIFSGLLKTGFSCVSKLSHRSSHWQVRTEPQALLLLPRRLIFAKATGCNFMPRKAP